MKAGEDEVDGLRVRLGIHNIIRSDNSREEICDAEVGYQSIKRLMASAACNGKRVAFGMESLQRLYDTREGLDGSRHVVYP